MSTVWFKNRLTDLKYFYWVVKNWHSLKYNKYSLKPFLIYWLLYPIPRLFLGRRIAHKILPKLTSYFKERNILIPLPIEGKNIYWIGIRDSIDFDIFRDVCIKDHYNRSLLKPGMTVVDVGAHIGTFTLSASKVIGESGKIITLEPEIRNYEQLLKNLRLNKINNCVVINSALSDHDGEEPLFISKKSCAHSLILNNSAVDETRVRVRTLDSLLKELNVGKIDFLKIDVEGVSFEALKGSRRILLNNPKMKIVIDYDGRQQKEIIQYLKSFNFTPKISNDLITVG